MTGYLAFVFSSEMLLAIGSWLLAVGCWLLAIGIWLAQIYKNIGTINTRAGISGYLQFVLTLGTTRTNTFGLGEKYSPLQCAAYSYLGNTSCIKTGRICLQLIFSDFRPSRIKKIRPE